MIKEYKCHCNKTNYGHYNHLCPKCHGTGITYMVSPTVVNIIRKLQDNWVYDKNNVIDRQTLEDLMKIM